MSEEEPIYQVITANRLGDGVIVYFRGQAGENGWSEDIHDAAVIEDDNIETELKKAEADAEANRVVGIYSFEITGDHKPISAREKIRAEGPSIRYGDDAVPFNNSDFEI